MTASMTGIVRKDGVVVAINDGGRMRAVVRDETTGRIVGLEGPSTADVVVDRLDALAAVTGDVLARSLEAGGWQRSGDLLLWHSGVSARRCSPSRDLARDRRLDEPG